MKILSVLFLTIVLVSCGQKDLKKSLLYADGHVKGYMHIYSAETIDDEISFFQSRLESVQNKNLIKLINDHIHRAEEMKVFTGELAVDLPFPWPCPKGRLCDSTLSSFGIFNLKQKEDVTVSINNKEIEVQPPKYFKYANITVYKLKESLTISKEDSLHIEIEMNSPDPRGSEVKKTFEIDRKFYQ